MRWLYQLLHRRAIRRGHALDWAHQAPNGDRLPLGDVGRILREWR